MRSMLLASSSIVFALSAMPAFAAEPEDTNAAGQIAERLNDPLTQYAVAGMLSAMTKAVLDMRVEPIAKAAEGIAGKRISDLPPNATVADVTGTRHDKVRDGLVKQVPSAMKAMGAMASAAEKMAPEFEKMARDMRQSIPQF